MIRICNSIREYLTLVSYTKKIICLGAGKYVRHILECEESEQILSKIAFFVDNDESKKTIQVGMYSYKVESFSNLLQTDLSDCIFFITIVEYSELLEQLQGNIKTKSIDCFLLVHFNGLLQEEYALSRKLPKKLKLSGYPIIPKKIHYFWFGGNPLPDKYKEWMASWKKYCPDYEIIEWNESNYDVTKNKYMYQAYQAKKWSFASDYARLDIIYLYGGIYLDTDVELISPLDDLLYQNAFSCFECKENVAFGLGFGASKGNKLIKELRDFYETKNFLNEDGSFNLMPCPQIQTEVLLKKGLVQNGEYQVVDGMTIYPEKMLSGMSGTTRRIKLTDYTKAIHHYEGTWVSENKKKSVELRASLFNDIF